MRHTSLCLFRLAGYFLQARQDSSLPATYPEATLLDFVTVLKLTDTCSTTLCSICDSKLNWTSHQLMCVQSERLLKELTWTSCQPGCSRSREVWANEALHTLKHSAGTALLLERTPTLAHLCMAHTRAHEEETRPTLTIHCT